MKIHLRFLIPLLGVLTATAASAKQGVAVQNNGETIIAWATPDGSVHVANDLYGEGSGTFSQWTPLAGVDLNTPSNGAVSAPAALALHDSTDTWDVLWQGPGDTLFLYTVSNQTVTQVTVGGTPVNACSAPTFTIAPSGTIYAAFAGCSGIWIEVFGQMTFVPTFPLTVYALSGGTWSSVPAPAPLLEPGTAPSIFARTQGPHAGEIDVAFQSENGSLDYLFSAAGRDPTVASSWSSPVQVAPTITSEPSLYVNPQDEADIVAQLPNDVLGIWHAKPGAAWRQTPMAQGSATGAPSIGGGLYAADPTNAPGSLAQVEVIASPENLEGPPLIGVGQFVSSMSTFGFTGEGMLGSTVVLGVGAGGITPGTKNTAGQPEAWESNVTVMATDANTYQLNIGDIESGSLTDPANWGLFGPAVFKNPYCAYPVTFKKNGNGARSGNVTIVPIYWGFAPSSSEPNWPDFYDTLLGSSYYHWITKEYGLTSQISAVAPQSYGANDSTLYSNSGTNCQATDESCIVETKLHQAAQAGTLPNPTGNYDTEVFIIHSKDGPSGCATGFNNPFTWTDSSNQSHDIFYGITSQGACSPDDVEATVSHELLESLTDPQVGGGWQNTFTANDCPQIADLCQSEGFHIFSNATGTNWRMDRMWSNAANSCVSTSQVPVAIQVLGMCVAVENGSSANGTPVVLAACTGETSQQWYLSSDGRVSPAFALDKCLDLPGFSTADKTLLSIYDCNGGANQRWTRYADGTIRGLGAKCVDDPGWATKPGTQLEYYGCNGGGNQSYQLQ